jgi:uncharacterized protein (DUF302 family)
LGDIGESSASFQRSIICAYPVPDVVARLRAARQDRRRGPPTRGRAGDNVAPQFRRRAIGALFATALAAPVLGGHVMAADGLTTVPSNFGPRETMDRLEAEIKAKGMSVFARIDHAAGAAAVGMPLRPTEVLIFGAAKAGTPLMQADQAVGIDLPLKALVYQDSAGKVWLAYNDPRWIAHRHDLGAAVAPNVDAMAKALEVLAGDAAGSR